MRMRCASLQNCQKIGLVRPRLLRSFELSQNRRHHGRRRKRRWQSAAWFRRSRSRI
nr:MAG TPA: hypothetical protein [Caudoviricetes sp.]